MAHDDRNPPDVGDQTVHLSELTQFTRQMGVMLEAGIDILRALDVAARQSGNSRLVRVSREIAAIMADGRLFGEAANRYPEVFSPFYVQMSRQGEREGVLGPALTSLADYLDLELERGPGGAGASSVAATSLISALLATLGFSIAGAAVLIAVGHTLQWGEWTVAAALGWPGISLMVSAGWLAWRASRGPSFCVSCGRPMPPASGWKMGPRMCNACVRIQVTRLKTPDRSRQEAGVLADVVLETDTPAVEAEPVVTRDRGVPAGLPEEAERPRIQL